MKPKRRNVRSTAVLMQALEHRVLLFAGPSELVDVNGTLFCSLSDGASGRELWKSDGTTAGTVLVKDINPGSGDGDPSGLVNVNGALFFLADDGTNGRALWTSDGTAAGTKIVYDPGEQDIDYGLTVGGDDFVYFFVDSDLWCSDGTEGGAIFVKDSWSEPLGYGDAAFGTVSGVTPSTTGVYFTFLHGILYGNTSYERYHAAGGSPSSASFQRYDYSDRDAVIGPWIAGGKEYFVVEESWQNDDGLWVVDGSQETLLRADPVDQYRLTAVGNTLYFVANDDDLWKTNGTVSGTVLVKSNVAPYDLTAVNGTLYFTSDGNLWKSNGTSAGTVVVKDITPGSDGYVRDFVGVGNRLFFISDVSGGDEIWTSDGTSAGTVRVKDIKSGSAGCRPDALAAVGNTLFFSAEDGVHGQDLWKSDGTSAGTSLVKDLSAPSPVEYYGNETADNVVVRIEGAELLISNNGNVVDSYPAIDVSRVTISTSGASDIVDCSTITLPIYIDAGDGDDTLKGGVGNDTLIGGGGANDLFGGDGNDRISAGEGNDTIRGWNGDDIIDAGAGDDWIICGDGGDKVAAGDGNDTVSGGAQKDTLDGGLGNDRLNGNGGHDRLYGYAGADRLYGYDGNDWLDGGSSNDRLEGGGGLDSLFGQGGNDRCFAGDGEVDQVFGGKDSDTASADASDVLASIETTTV